MHEFCIRGGWGKCYAPRRECDRRNLDLHVDGSHSLCGNDNGYKLQLGRDGDRLRRHHSHTYSKRFRHLHRHCDQLGKWLHEFGIGGSWRNSLTPRCECDGRNSYLHNDGSCTFRGDHLGHKLQLGRTRDRLRRHDGHTDSERYGHVHSDSDELSEWLHEFGIGGCWRKCQSPRRQCDRRNLDLHDDGSYSLCRNDNRHELQLGRNGNRLRRLDGDTGCERLRHLYGDRDQLSKWLHQLGIRSCRREYNTPRCECDRRNIDLHDDGSYSLCRNDNRNKLQLVRTRDRLRRHNGHTGCERLRHLHRDCDQLG